MWTQRRLTPIASTITANSFQNSIGTTSTEKKCGTKLTKTEKNLYIYSTCCHLPRFFIIFPHMGRCKFGGHSYMLKQRVRTLVSHNSFWQIVPYFTQNFHCNAFTVRHTSLTALMELESKMRSKSLHVSFAVKYNVNTQANIENKLYWNTN